jgi:AcrR family transcriptional regulator
MSDKRAALLETATALFAEHGYHAVGVDRIIAESGVAKMTMYRHFPSKEDLVVEVLRTRSDHFISGLTEFVDKYTAPMDRLKAVFVWHDRMFSEEAFYGCIFVQAAAEFSDANSPIHKMSVACRQQLATLLKQLIGDVAGGRRAGKLSNLLLMMIDGATVNAQMFGPSGQGMQIWQVARQLLEA